MQQAYITLNSLELCKLAIYILQICPPSTNTVTQCSEVYWTPSTNPAFEINYLSHTELLLIAECIPHITTLMWFSMNTQLVIATFQPAHQTSSQYITLHCIVSTAWLWVNCIGHAWLSLLVQDNAYRSTVLSQNTTSF